VIVILIFGAHNRHAAAKHRGRKDKNELVFGAHN